MISWIVSRRAFCWVGFSAAITGLIACSRRGDHTATFAPTPLTVASTAPPTLSPSGTPANPAMATTAALPATPATPQSATAQPSASVARPGSPAAIPQSCTPTRSISSATTSPIGTPPARASVGQGHILSGIVRSSRDCAPLAGAQLFIWLARPDGQYAPTHEALVTTDQQGAYRFESNYPGRYEGTTPHIHLFIVAGGHVGIEQNYQPPANQTAGTFNFVLAPR